MKERIQKILSGRGIASRRQAEEWIQMGRVQVNGRVCTLGENADPDVDEIFLDGKRIPSRPNKMYIMLNKPRGFVTTLSDEKGRKNVAQLVVDCGQRVYPVGRLDMDSEGLLLFTNDGDFANNLMHPSHEVRKTYLVTVDHCTYIGIDRLNRPMELDGYPIQKPSIKLLTHPKGPSNRASLEITIHEGRNRQIRRMCAIADMKVLQLTRIAEGSVVLGDLPSGKWRYLTEKEIEVLKE